MKKHWIFMIALLFFFNTMNAQTKDDDVERVSDAVTRETFITFHKRQLDNFEIMREKEGTIVATQELIKKESEEIARIENEIYTNLSRVSNIILDLRAVITIAQDGRKIIQYLNDCDSLIIAHPELLLIGNDTRVAIISRVEQLGVYLATATTGGEMNLMNNADRLKIISRVATDMRILKGNTFYLRWQLEFAIKNGFWRSLFPGLFRWESLLENQIRTSERIISDFHL